MINLINKRNNKKANSRKDYIEKELQKQKFLFTPTILQPLLLGRE